MAREMYKRRRYCRFSAEGIKQVDYKDVDLLKDFISENAKIIPARMTAWEPLKSFMYSVTNLSCRGVSFPKSSKFMLSMSFLWSSIIIGVLCDFFLIVTHGCKISLTRCLLFF